MQYQAGWSYTHRIDASSPLSFQPEEGAIVERIYDGKIGGGKGFYQEQMIRNIHIAYAEIDLNPDVELMLAYYPGTINMHFMLCGDTYARSQSSTQQYRFTCNEHNLLFLADNRSRNTRYIRKKFHAFEVKLHPDFFKKHLPLSHNFFHQFWTKIETGQTSTLSHANLRISPQMQLVIHDLIDCKRKWMYKRMFLEAKVIELLMLQLEQINTEYGKQIIGSAKTPDIEKMYAIKEIIAKNLTSTYTLSELAHQVGTNEYTLKKCFKELFGTTVFGFWKDLKMETAKKLLLEKQVSVREASDAAGYKNPQHFTVAFKKKYGVLPSTMKA
ncbi:MAG: AraC family transcriptional regulator [Bacteroidota bacterium]